MQPNPGTRFPRTLGPAARLLLALAAVLILAGVVARWADAQRAPAEAAAAPQAVDTPAAAATDTLAVPGAVDTLLPQATGVGSAEVAQQPSGVGAARADLDTTFGQRVVSAFGIIVLLLLAWAMSIDRRLIHWRVVLWGIGLQLLFALFILKTPIGVGIFAGLNQVIVALLGFTVEGARFLFGDLVWGTVPVGGGEPGTNIPVVPTPGMAAQTGAFFAFNVLPTIIFFSSLMTLLYHIGFMQALVKGVAWVMMRTMRTSGAETLSAAGNIFVGQTEAPLMIKPFVGRMTMSELMAVMTAGFATVAGGVMAAYVGMLIAFFPDIAGHLIAASVMSAPAALATAKLMYPEKEEPETRGTLKVEVESPDVNVIDAAARGAGEGLHLALNVGAMLLAFIALIALLNAVIGWTAGVVGLNTLLQGQGWIMPGASLSLEAILGWLFAPLAWIMGVPWQDATTIGTLLGVKMALNEFVAYLQLSSLLAAGEPLSPRSIVIATYALCGFANFSSIAIQIGGIGGIAPSRRSDLSRVGLRAMIGGTIAAFLTATVAGMVL
jgi:concentrative nucleoside transporter, CNT family